MWSFPWGGDRRANKARDEGDLHEYSRDICNPPSGASFFQDSCISRTPNHNHSGVHHLVNLSLIMMRPPYDAKTRLRKKGDLIDREEIQYLY